MGAQPPADERGPANALVRGAIVLRDLPMAGQAALSGQISAAHVQALVYGLRHVGLEPMRQHEEVLLEVALNLEPAELFITVKHLQARIHPGDLDDAYQRGMDKQDINVDALLDGFHVTGLLNTVTGAKLKKVLDSVSAPDGADDTRSGSQRRVQGLDELLDSILGNGLPSDKGVRPHLSVFVDAETLAAAAEHVQQATENPFTVHDPTPPVEPATLAGHGAISLNLLMYFYCVSDVTNFLMKTGGGTRQAQILNAGRDKYQPNTLQRRSVIARQKGVCATPGCHHTHLEIHHVVFWSMGGRTNLDQLIGLCTRCHHLLHRGRLHISGNAVDGFQFTNRSGRTLRRRRQTRYREAA